MPARTSRLTATRQFESLADLFECEPTHGSWDIDHNGMKLHALLDWKGADTTLVTFTGAVSPKVDTVPVWSAYRSSEGLGVNRLFISDPTLAITKKLRLGWYAGNSLQPDLQNDVTRLIEYASQRTRVVLFGPSAGGFTSLVQASRLPGSTALVSNPQTDIAIRPAFPSYKQHAWGLPHDVAHPFITNVVDVYRRPKRTQIVYLQNLGDEYHVEFHQRPFMDALHPGNKVTTVSPDLGPGHIGPDAESFNRLFRAVCRTPDWDQLVDAVQSLHLTRNL